MHGGLGGAGGGKGFGNFLFFKYLPHADLN